MENNASDAVRTLPHPTVLLSEYMKLFNNNTASSRIYRNVRDSDTSMMIHAR